MKVVFFHRKPKSFHYSVEIMFSCIRELLPSNVVPTVAVSKYDSSGIAKRFYNVLEAYFRQGDINHITGDVHFLSYCLSRKKTILTILDCVVDYNTSGFKNVLLRYFWYVLPERCVDYITVISESTKKELLKFIKCSPDKVHVIPACISPKFSKTPKVFNKNNPVILQIGTTQNKNLIRVIEAISGINCRLDIVGQIDEEIRFYLERFRIEYSQSQFLTDEEVLKKYQNCDILMFASTYEGFGMPIIEANVIGRPVITSDIYSMPEVAGNAACIVNPYNVGEIRTAVLKIVTDDFYRDGLVQAGYANGDKYSASAIASKYLELYEQIHKGNNS